MTISIEVARRIVELHGWVASLRKDLEEIDTGTVGKVTVVANYSVPKNGSSWDTTRFKREVDFTGDDAKWVAGMIRKRKQLRLDAYIRELRQLNASIPE